MSSRDKKEHGVARRKRERRENRLNPPVESSKAAHLEPEAAIPTAGSDANAEHEHGEAGTSGPTGSIVSITDANKQKANGRRLGEFRILGFKLMGLSRGPLAKLWSQPIYTILLDFKIEVRDGACINLHGRTYDLVRVENTGMKVEAYPYPHHECGITNRHGKKLENGRKPTIISASGGYVRGKTASLAFRALDSDQAPPRRDAPRGSIEHQVWHKEALKHSS